MIYIRLQGLIGKKIELCLFAADFLGAAFSLTQGSIAKMSSRFYLSSKQPSNKALRTLAILVVSEPSRDPVMAEPVLLSKEASYGKIRTLRSALHNFPRNPLALMDLAREYVGLGQSLAAVEASSRGLGPCPWKPVCSEVGSTVFSASEGQSAST